MPEHPCSVENPAHDPGVAKDAPGRRIASRLLPAHRMGRLPTFKLSFHLSEIDEWVHADGAGDDTTALGEKATR